MAIEAGLVIVGLIMFALVSLTVYKLFVDFDPVAQEEFTQQNASQIWNNSYAGVDNWADNTVAMVVGLLWAGAIALAFVVDTHPVFFALNILVLVAVLIVGAIVANGYEELAGDFALSTAFPITNFIFTHLVLVAGSIMLTVGIALYAKARGGGA